MPDPNSPTAQQFAEQALQLAPPHASAGAALLDRSRRLGRLIPVLACQPELSSVRFDRGAVELAAMFFEAGRAVGVRMGRIPPQVVLTATLDDALREAGVDALASAAAALGLPDGTTQAAVSAIRQVTWRSGASPEAEILAEAVNLDDIGPIMLWQEIQSAALSHDDMLRVLSRWRSQAEYGYWEARISELLRFAWTRQVARRRLAAMQVFLESLESQISGEST